jgi:hypothetical protein
MTWALKQKPGIQYEGCDGKVHTLKQVLVDYGVFEKNAKNSGDWNTSENKPTDPTISWFIHDITFVSTDGISCFSKQVAVLTLKKTTSKTMTIKIYSPEDFKRDNHEAKVKAEGAKLRAQKEFQAKVEKLVEEFNRVAKNLAEDLFHAHLPRFPIITDTKELAVELASRLSSVGWKTTEPVLFDELAMSHCKHQFWVTKP